MTTREWAYSLLDAMTQAAFQMSLQHPDCEAKVTKVGPPQSMITEVTKTVDDAMRRLKRGAKP